MHHSDPYANAITIRHCYQCRYVICAYDFELGRITSFKSARRTQLSFCQPIINPYATAISLVDDQCCHSLLAYGFKLSCIISFNSARHTQLSFCQPANYSTVKHRHALKPGAFTHFASIKIDERTSSPRILEHTDHSFLFPCGRFGTSLLDSRHIYAYKLTAHHITILNSSVAHSYSVAFGCGIIKCFIPCFFSVQVTATESSAQATATATQVPIGSSGQFEQYTTSTIFSTRTATITACPSTVTNCPASAKTTFVTTETVFISTTICPITGSPSVTGRANPENTFLATGNPVVSVSPVFSTRTATLTSCPSGLSDCPPTEVVTQVTTETLLVGKSMYTLPAATSTYSFQTLSPFSRPSPASGMSGNAIPTSAQHHYSTAIISKTTLSSSSTPLPSTTSTTQAAAPLFTGVGSFSHHTSCLQVLLSFAMAGLVLFCL
ncbi:hypothetical protein CNMCM5793_006729 [Aspergillus hiratsukae]|nr:hypothetical protein CNMCM5793_006729 [Aspergillus hiratsukae]